MRCFFFYFLSLLVIIGCKTATIPSNSLSKELLEAAHLEIEDMAKFALKQNIEQLQTSIPVNAQQTIFLEGHTRFKNVILQNQKEFTNWLNQQKEHSDKEQKEALLCLQQGRPMLANCAQNRILSQLNEAFFPEIIHDVSNYSVQFVVDKQWIPEHEPGNDCKDVQRGNFYYYMPGGSSEVVYVTRTDSSQKESLEGALTNRRVTWTSDCSYQLTAWEKEDTFQLDFEIVHVASDHYLFLCKMPYKGTATTLLLGRVNKSLE